VRVEGCEIWDGILIEMRYDIRQRIRCRLLFATRTMEVWSAYEYKYICTGIIQLKSIFELHLNDGKGNCSVQFSAYLPLRFTSQDAIINLPYSYISLSQHQFQVTNSQLAPKIRVRSTNHPAKSKLPHRLSRRLTPLWSVPILPLRSRQA
jgi:hypothetical protein